MDKEQLKEAVGELNLVDTVFEADGVSYIDTAVSVMQVYDLIDQLEEPEKVIIPQFVAEWYESNKDDLELEMFSTVHSIIRSKYDEYTEFEKWFNKNDGNEPIETIVKMKLYGYEVEKEKLYYIELIKGKRCMAQVADGACWFPYGRKDVLSGVDKIEFTESEIKSIDERFWPFAVEVTE